MVDRDRGTTGFLRVLSVIRHYENANRRFVGSRETRQTPSFLLHATHADFIRVEPASVCRAKMYEMSVRPSHISILIVVFLVFVYCLLMEMCEGERQTTTVVRTSDGRLHTTTRAFPSHDVHDGARRLRHRLTEPRVLRGESGTARLGQRSAEPEAHQGGTGADLPSLSFLTADERTSRFRSREPVGGSLAPAARQTTRPAPPAFPPV